MLWAVVVAIILQILAYLLYKLGPEILEDDGHFKIVVATFFILFMAAGVFLRFVLPNPGEAQVSLLVQSAITPAFAESQLTR